MRAHRAAVSLMSIPCRSSGQIGKESCNWNLYSLISLRDFKLGAHSLCMLFGKRFFPRFLKSAIVLGLLAVAVPTAFGQTDAAPAPVTQQNDSSSTDAQNPGQPAPTSPTPAAQQNGPSSTGAQKPAQATPSARTGADRSRLAVNPVTGLVTSTATNYEPLSGKERWKLYFKQNLFSIGAYFGPVAQALVLDQPEDSPRQWGPGLSGFGLRLASRTGGSVLQGTIQAPIAAALHEDVRYISSPQHGFKRRVVHAVEYTFLTYNSDGHRTVNVANLSAYYASTAISTTWLPGRRSVVEYTFSNASEQIVLSMPVNLLQEFWPEVTHKVLRHL